MNHPAFVFGRVGALLWATAGFVVGMISLEPASGWSVTKANPATAQAIASSVWSSTVVLCLIWSGIGAAYGLVVMTLYGMQPAQTRYTAAPNPLGGPTQSIAEVEVTMAAFG